MLFGSLRVLSAFLMQYFLMMGLLMHSPIVS